MMDECTWINDRLRSMADQLQEMENVMMNLERIEIDANDYEAVCKISDMMVRMVTVDNHVRDVMKRIIDKAQKVRDDFIRVIVEEVKQVYDEDNGRN